MAFVSTPYIFFCGICGNELEGLAQQLADKNFFLAGQPSLAGHLFCYHIYQHDDTQKGHLDCCLSLCNSPLLLQSGLDSDISTGTQNTDASPSSTSLGNIPGKLLCYTLRGIREKVKSNKGPGGKELNPSGMTLSLPLVHLHPALVVEPEGTSKAPVLVRERLSPTREGKFQWKVCLHLHLEQGRMPLVERSDGCGCCFFLSYRQELTITEPLL